MKISTTIRLDKDATISTSGKERITSNCFDDRLETDGGLNAS